MEPDIEHSEHHSESLEDYDCGSDEVDDLEDHEDEEEVFDRQAYGLYQQLPIKKGAPDLSAGPPQTAEEYLRRVRYIFIGEILLLYLFGIKGSHP